MADFDSYVICTSPRSGSTLLCKLLAATGICGNPKSYFYDLSVAEWLDELELEDQGGSERETLEYIFRTVIAKGTLDTGIFGLRQQRRSFDFFLEKSAILYPDAKSDREIFEMAFGRTRFIYLTRLDKVEQAVSITIAEKTGLWHKAPDGTEIEREEPTDKPGYDGETIRRHYETFLDYDRKWKNWFQAEKIEPISLTYEALSADPIATLRHVLKQLGLDPDAADSVTPGVAKLADETNRQWAARFRQQYNIS
ncbi:Stf0 family sulfotransferase [Rhizobium sp. L1K21]|uniref:Stf0 family sulfotransferase n=1 Tax=Rhizobium sp. L1K21 TaxID=2954933 RepID=UPI0020940157|nr:Stf0 family sulfotransferase [Rhizobium sp. L1K21]MCO6185889.1 Stf0 sulfotransferase family protein [Rhizobium sp. L1K21]